jgi:hypothetical protein
LVPIFTAVTWAPEREAPVLSVIVPNNIVVVCEYAREEASRQRTNAVRMNNLQKDFPKLLPRTVAASTIFNTVAQL